MKFKRFEHGWITSFSVTCWCWLLLWSWPRFAQAQALSAEVKGYDWASIGYAALLGLLGGGLAFIVALASDRRVVLAVLKESWRNALVSPVGGMAMYLLLKAAVALNLFSLQTEPRFVLIVGAGWAGVAFIAWLNGIVTRLAGKAAKKLEGRVLP